MLCIVGLSVVKNRTCSCRISNRLVDHDDNDDVSSSPPDGNIHKTMALNKTNDGLNETEWERHGTAQKQR